MLIVYTIGFAAFAVRPPLEEDAGPKPPIGQLRANFDSGLSWLLAASSPRSRRAPR